MELPCEEGQFGSDRYEENRGREISMDWRLCRLSGVDEGGDHLPIPNVRILSLHHQ